MKETKENLEGIVLKLKDQGVKAGQEEKYKIVEAAKKQAEELLVKAKLESNQIIQEAKTSAAQFEKNGKAALAQASRDLIEATKIAILKHLQSTFGKQCESLFTEEQYLSELLPVVLANIPGNKKVAISSELMPQMESYLLKDAINKGVELQALPNSEAKIVVNCDEKSGIQFVISAKDIQESVFSLVNQNLVELLTNNEEK
ncbi:hypothetical protein [Ancylomarina sp. 16SWW S1-10-2]|uniref:hypothetical protein n=1 Tax=Ancylomarina sp. 16SWW S1-10-2 TaxID=2499681 RepID=UPI0012AD8B14|nr:hypothetical protein [Ancylomarina sp. 16SWW S1-10-2]MRT92962.1 hypothetical protein [Ancylomarina sp. 16SWW S1-10-2]